MISSVRILQIVFRQKTLIFDFVLNDIKARYWGSFMGLWGSIINPLLILLIYCFVFSGILKIKFGHSGVAENFAINVFCALIPWISFSEAAQRSSTVIFDQLMLIKRMIFPKEILPFYITLSVFVTQLIALTVFLIILPVIGFQIGGYLLFLPLIFIFQLLFTVGVCLLLSSLNIFFRDIGIYLSSLLQLWMFCTPIFYPSSMIPDSLMPIMRLNPMYHYVTIYRDIILYNLRPPPMSLLNIAIFSSAAYMLGAFVFMKLSDKIVDYL